MHKQYGNSNQVIYRIQVRGHLAQRWLDWFDGFKMTYNGEDTILTGSIIDQAALHGVMAKIRDLGLPILLVKRLEGSSDDYLLS